MPGHANSLCESRAQATWKTWPRRDHATVSVDEGSLAGETRAL